MNKLKLLFLFLRIPVDLTAIYLGLLTSFWLRYELLPANGLLTQVPLTLLEFLSTTFWLPIAGFVSLISIGAYRTYRSDGLPRQFTKILSATLLWFFMLTLFYFVFRAQPFSRLAVIYIYVFSFGYLLIGRTILNSIYQKLLEKGKGRLKVLLLGANKSAQKMAQQLSEDPHYDVLGFHNKSKPKKFSQTLHYFGSYSRIEQTIRQKKPDIIVQSTTEKDLSHAPIIELCRQHHLEYYTIPETFDLYEHSFQMVSKSGLSWLEWQKTPLNGWGRLTKRIFDLAVSIPALALLSPLLLLAAILIKLDSQGTIFFRYLDNGKIAKRIGQRGEKFYCYKFRTMHPNTHSKRYKELKNKNVRGDGPLIKINNDPRVTRIGKWLRRFDIDELPQLINVIKGDMSIVGPRPHLPEEVKLYKPHQRFVLTVKPGITGLAQISGRSHLEFNDEVKLDSYYIAHWSIWLDIKIILKTIPIAFQKNNH